MRIAMSSACILASRLIDLVASPAARASVATWSTPGSPCSTWRSAASEVATSDSHRRSVATSFTPAPPPSPAPPPAHGLTAAKPGLITVLMIFSRSSNGANALFIALIVSHSMSPQP